MTKEEREERARRISRHTGDSRDEIAKKLEKDFKKKKCSHEIKKVDVPVNRGTLLADF